MVRINLINPKYLSDQHLRGEYFEILKLIWYVEKHPTVKKHISGFQLHNPYLFWKDKLKYVFNRHISVKQEMRQRGFKTDRHINALMLPVDLYNDFAVKPEYKKIVKKRILERLLEKPEWYKYYGERKNKSFWVKMMREAQ